MVDSMMQMLPGEVLLAIMHQVESRDLLSLAQVSKNESITPINTLLCFAMMEQES